MTVEQCHHPSAEHDIPTASCVRRKATPAAVDMSAPSTSANRFATQRFRLIVDD
jgi:hypothetical protein